MARMSSMARQFNTHACHLKCEQMWWLYGHSLQFYNRLSNVVWSCFQKVIPCRGQHMLAHRERDCEKDIMGRDRGATNACRDLLEVILRCHTGLPSDGPNLRKDGVVCYGGISSNSFMLPNDNYSWIRWISEILVKNISEILENGKVFVWQSSKFHYFCTRARPNLLELHKFFFKN